MGDFERDTRVEGGNGRFAGTVSEDWEIWGPMGGYAASLALRAAAAEVGEARLPASFTCQFFSPARFEPVVIDVAVRRASRRTAAVSASMTQDGVAILDAQAWFAAEADIVRHDHAPRHRHGHPDDHKPISEYTVEPAPFPFWENFEGKPLDWVEDWEHYPGGAPEWAEWLRFVPRAAFEDPVMEACRLVLMADLPSYPAATRAHPGTRSRAWVSPNLDLAVQFHRLADLGEWLLTSGTAPVADRGLIGFRSEVWTAHGVLAASGSGQLLSRGATRIVTPTARPVVVRQLGPDEVVSVSAVLGLARLDQGDGFYLVAWEGEEPLGHAHLALTDPPELQDVSVRPEHRRRGIATALTTAAEGEASARGFDRLRLTVGVDNEAAQALYRGVGYRDAGIAPQRVQGTIVIRTGPIEVDDTLLTWEKRLRDRSPRDA